MMGQLLMKPGHRAASRMLGFTLVRGDEAAWLEFAAVLSARLAAQERIAEKCGLRHPSAIHGSDADLFPLPGFKTH